MNSMINLGWSLPLFLILVQVAIRADDWPQFLGPNRDGISKETALNLDWAKKEPRVVWKADVSVGVSSCAIVGGRLYTLGNDHSKDVVLCLDAKTGKQIWKQIYRCKNETRNFDGGTASTPTFDEGRVYTLSHQGNLFCWNAENGEKIWEADFVDDYKGQKSQWGWAESPLIAGNLVVVQAGGKDAGLIALDKVSGKLVWKQGNDQPGYASGLALETNGAKAVAFFNAAGLVASNLADGKELFRFPWKTDFDVNASMPLLHDGALFISSGYSSGCAVIDVKNGAPVEKWRNKTLSLHFQNSVLVDGKVYAVSGDNRENMKGELRCIDFATGALAWSEPMGKTYGEIIVVAGKLLIMTDQGELVLVQPSPEKYAELSRIQVLGGARAWVAPAFSNGLIYCRQNLGSLVCLDLNP
jgi:outer membrane protein assembly factor BamB